MKLSAFVAIGAVIGSSFIAPNPAEARNGWVITTDISDHRVYSKVERDGNDEVHLSNRVIYNDGEGFDFKTVISCKKWSKYNPENPEAEWSPIYPITAAEDMANRFC